MDAQRNNRTKRYQFRANKNEQQTIERLFAESGEKKISDFLRKMTLNGKIEINESKKTFDELGKNLKNLNRLGSLLGSYLRAIEANEEAYSGKKISDMVKDLNAMKVKIFNIMMTL